MIRLSIVTSGAAVVMASPSGGFTLDINTVLTALGVGGGAAAIWKIVGLVVDKVVPDRADKRSDVETSLGALAKTIEILSAEKASDAAAVARANARVVQLETDGVRDYDLIRVLKDTASDLQRRVEAKDRHIAELARELAMYGALVTFDDNGMLHIARAKHTTGPIPTV